MVYNFVPLILGLIFLTIIAGLLIHTFKQAGYIFATGILAGLLNVLGLFFALGSKISLVGISALIVGLFYALFLSYFILGFFKKLFSIEFLDKDNTFVVFKRGIIFATDISLPLFVLSTLIAFLAPLHLREFGITLSLCILVFFIFIPVISTLISLRYVNNNFLLIGNIYRSGAVEVDHFLNRCVKSYSNKSTLTFGLSSLGLMALAAIIFFFWGFNSFSIFKNNYLVTVILDNASLKSGKNLESVKGDLSAEKLLEKIPVEAKVFGNAKDQINILVKGAFDQNELKNLLDTNLDNSGYYIQETSSFSDTLTLKDISIVLAFSFLLISVYIFIRFRFKNLLILLTNSLFSFLLLCSVFVLFRIAVYSSFFIGMCAYFAFSIMYHIFLFNIDKQNSMDWFKRISPDITHIFYSLMKKTIFAYIVCALLTTNEEVILTSLYTFASMFVVHYLSSFLYFVLSDRLDYIQETYIWKKETIELEDEDTKAKEDLNNLDPFDEEIIIGINKSY